MRQKVSAHSTIQAFTRRSTLIIVLAASMSMIAAVASAQSLQFPIPTSVAEVPAPPPGTAMTKAYVSRGDGKAKSH